MNGKTTGQSSGGSRVEVSQDTDGVGLSDEEGHGKGSLTSGSPPNGDGGNHLSGREPVVPPEDGDHLRERHPQGVPGPEYVGQLEQQLTEAFGTGNPEAVWNATRTILSYAEQITTEAAKLRFQVNFGTDRCQNCSGLKAGPGVVATCFQMRLCFYTNFRGDTATPKQIRLAEYLAEKKSGV